MNKQHLLIRLPKICAQLRASCILHSASCILHPASAAVPDATENVFRDQRIIYTSTGMVSC
jgi:hypothetical protein